MVGLQPADSAPRRVGLAVGEQRRVRDEPLSQHLDVAHLAELGTEPAQLGAQLERPFRIDEVAQRPEVGAQPAGRDAGLVHGFRVAFGPQRGLVGVEPPHRRRDNHADHVRDEQPPFGHVSRRRRATSTAPW